jgi:hypothetical protein
MTLLNTFTNLGGTWPKFFVLKGIDLFTVASCAAPDKTDATLNTPGASFCFLTRAGADADAAQRANVCPTQARRRARRSAARAPSSATDTTSFRRSAWSLPSSSSSRTSRRPRGGCRVRLLFRFLLFGVGADEGLVSRSAADEQVAHRNVGAGAMEWDGMGWDACRGWLRA